MRLPTAVTRHILTLATLALGLVLGGEARAQGRFTIDVESGAAAAGYNDARIPGDSGTLFSFTDDLSSETVGFFRVRGEFRIAPRHVVSVLAAPLTIDGSGSFNRPVRFMDTTFEPGVPIRSRYVFNSYRMTYRYDVFQGSRWKFGIGVTGKIRDALTRLEAAGRRDEKTNVGFVPLVNFKLERLIGDRATFEIEGDALAAPQGRAEDVFIGFRLPVGRAFSVRAGYRFLEGGADNDEVYTFAMVHYLAIGVSARF